jgi:hypothetical protein
VFVDETAWTIECVKTSDWAPVREKVTVGKPPSFDSLTTITSISNAGIGYTEIFRGLILGDIFTSYVRRQLASLYGHGTQCIVRDNASIHHKSVPDVIRVARHDVVFNAPYSPALNQIEKVFGFWTTRVKNEIVAWRGYTPVRLSRVRISLCPVKPESSRCPVLFCA